MAKKILKNSNKITEGFFKQLNQLNSEILKSFKLIDEIVNELEKIKW